MTPANGGRSPLAGLSAPKMMTVVQGDFVISADRIVILSTVLGSCVAVCLFDIANQLGGMNHFLLPATPDKDCGLNHVKFGAHSMEVLINGLIRAGAQRGALQAKVFGGASMTANLAPIGASNAAFAKDFLRAENIPCLSESLLGTQARRVLFHPATGAARMMLVPSHQATEIRPARPSPPRPEIELF